MTRIPSPYDGFRPVLLDDDDKITLIIEYSYAGEVLCSKAIKTFEKTPDIKCPPEVKADRLFYLADALCRYLDTYGSLEEAKELVDNFRVWETAEGVTSTVEVTQPDDIQVLSIEQLDPTTQMVITEDHSDTVHIIERDAYVDESEIFSFLNYLEGL